MRTKTVSWGEKADPARFLTVGEFSQGADYRTIRQSGTPNFLFILTLEGSGRITGPGGQSSDTQPGDILLYDPHAFHHYGTSPTVGYWKLTWSHFVPPARWDFWRQWRRAWEGLRTFHVGPITTGRARDALRMVYDTDFGFEETAGRFMLNCLERAWLHIHREQQQASRPDRDPRVSKALHFIEANLAEPLPVSLIARHCGLSESRFAHLFRAQTGKSPQRYVESRRMDRARELLRYTSLSVAEVAGSCGFEDPFYFSSRFRAFNGNSPRAFRQQG